MPAYIREFGSLAIPPLTAILIALSTQFFSLAPIVASVSPWSTAAVASDVHHVAARPAYPLPVRSTGVLLDMLAKQVGVIGVFSDWPATVTYYANCMGLK